MSLPGFLLADSINFQVGEKMHNSWSGPFYKGNMTDLNLAFNVREIFRHLYPKDIYCKVWALPKGVSEQDARVIFQREVALLGLVRGCTNVMQILCFTETPPTIVVPAFDLTLAKALENKEDRVWDSSQLKKSMALEIAGGLAAVHRMGALHNRLSAKNIMVTYMRGDRRRPSLIISDFSMGMALKSTQNEQPGLFVAMQNRYMAPEVLRNLDPNYKFMRSVCSIKSDMYSFGMVLYELVTRRIAYGEISDEVQVRDKVLGGMMLRMPPDLRPKLQPFANVFELCVQHDLSYRFTDMEVVQNQLSVLQIDAANA